MMQECAGRQGWVPRPSGFAWIVVAIASSVWGADWPTYQHDSRRSCATDERLVPPLGAQWTYHSLHSPSPAWPTSQWNEAKTVFDRVYHTVAVGDAVYFASSADGKVYALDAKTGAERWTFHTGGPVRIAPTVWDGRVYVASDDGWVYALRASDGEVAWTFHAAPGDDRVLGHGRMISRWPMRTGVLVDGGVAYFAAGLFPSEGTYLYAVDARTGKLIWKNDSSGAMYTDHPHPCCDGFSGVAPQGALVVSASKLFVPTGRSVPAAFDRKDGRFLYWYHARAWRHRIRDGGAAVSLVGNVLFASPGNTGIGAHAGGFDPDTGAKLIATPAKQVIGSGSMYYLLDRHSVQAVPEAVFQEEAAMLRELDPMKVWGRKLSDKQKARVPELEAALKAHVAKKRKARKWSTAVKNLQTMVLTRDVIYAGAKDRVVALASGTGKKLWDAPVGGLACGLAVAQGRLMVSTDKGTIHCFAQKAKGKARTVRPRTVDNPYPKDDLTPVYAAAAKAIVQHAGVERGYGLVLDSGTGRLAFELAKRTQLRLVCIEPDAKSAQAARRALDQAGLYGVRVTVDVGPADALPYPKYFANLIVCDRMAVSGHTPALTGVLRCLKPCGGVLLLGRPKGQKPQPDWAELTRLVPPSKELSPKRIDDQGRWLRVARGPLPGAADWSHQYGTAAGTACSHDRRVRAPFEVLWFGEPGPGKSIKGTLSPLVVAGRLFIGRTPVQAYDAYNGVKLWEAPIPHASQMVGAPDSMYVTPAKTSECLRLDARTGKTLATFPLPPLNGQTHLWGYLGLEGDALFGTGLAEFTLDKEDKAHAGALTGLRHLQRALKSTRGVVTRHGHRHWLISHVDRVMAEIDRAIGAKVPPERLAKYKSRLLRVLAGSASRYLCAVDRSSGEPIWTYDPGPGRYVCHASIAIGDGRAFLVEGRETNGPKTTKHLVALNACTGKKLWETQRDISTHCKPDKLLHRPPHRVLVNSTDLLSLGYRDNVLVLGEVWGGKTLFACSGTDGRHLWSQRVHYNYYYRRRSMVVGTQVYTDLYAYDLHTGKPVQREHPVSGKPTSWTYCRSYGCGGSSASAGALFFRSSVLSYYDLKQDEGITNFGAVRVGCWINAIPAAGLVVVPDQTRGCTCPYQIKTSLVFCPTDTPRAWSFVRLRGPAKPVKHLAVNLGAPGDRRDAQGTLWFGYPRPRHGRGYQFKLHDDIAPGLGYWRGSSDGRGITGTDKPWVYASGCCGLGKLRVPLGNSKPVRYTVRLHFVEPSTRRVGQRVFDILLQGKPVAQGFDVIKAAGRPNRAVTKTFKGIAGAKDLTVELVAKSGKLTKLSAPLLCGIEIRREP